MLTLLWNPSWLYDISFQLSYLAVAGILTFVDATMRALFGKDFRGGWWDWRAATVGVAVVSLAAQVFTYPLIAHSFGSVPLFSPLVNILAIPLATLLVPLGFLAGVLGLFSTWLAELLNLATGLLAGMLIKLADLAAALPGLPWGEIEPVGFAFYAIGALAITLAAHGVLRPWRGVLVALLAILSSTALIERARGEVVFLDVGQGDGVVLRLPGGVDILVDGGGSRFGDFDVGGRIVVPALRALGVRQLELVVATHAHIDHMEGLISVIEEVPVQLLVIGAVSEDRPVFHDLMAAAASNDVPVEKVTRGESLFIGDVRLDVVNPPRNRYGDIDADSVGFVLHVGERAKGVFLGDMPVMVEEDIAFPDVRLLMVPHHGSRHSTSEGLVLATRPETAVISYGRNNYGHPHPDVLDRLAQHDVEVRETFVEGAVRVPLNVR